MKALNNMRKKIFRKIYGQAGETIAETLIALLIAALALTMLAGVISASAGIVTKSEKKLNSYYSKNEDNAGVVKMSGNGEQASVTITNTDNSISGGTIAAYEIQYYSNDEFSKAPVIAYRKK